LFSTVICLATTAAGGERNNVATVDTLWDFALTVRIRKFRTLAAPLAAAKWKRRTLMWDSSQRSHSGEISFPSDRNAASWRTSMRQRQLFRPEAIAFQHMRQSGEVLLLQPTSAKLLFWVFAGAIVLIAACLALAQHARKATVAAYLAPAAGMPICCCSRRRCAKKSRSSSRSA
jgi:hypothetical protein